MSRIKSFKDFQTKSLNESVYFNNIEGASKNTVVVVDVQEDIDNHIHFNYLDFIREINKYKKIVWFYDTINKGRFDLNEHVQFILSKVEDDLMEECRSENEYDTDLADEDDDYDEKYQTILDESLEAKQGTIYNILHQINYIEKEYGFFRNIMDEFGYGEAYHLAKEMLDKNIDDIRNYDVDEHGEFESVDSDVVDFAIENEIFYIPKFMDDIVFNNLPKRVITMGGGMDECLAEIKIALDLKGVLHDDNTSFLY